MLRILLNNKLIKITDSKINYLQKKYFLNTNKYIILNILISVNENNKRINKYTKLNKKNKFNLMDFILSDKDIIWSNDKVKRKYLKKIFKHRLNNNFYQISAKSINRIYDIFIDKTIDLDPKRVQKIIRSDNMFPKIEKCIYLIYWEKKPIDILKKIGLDVYPEMKDIIPKNHSELYINEEKLKDFIINYLDTNEINIENNAYNLFIEDLIHNTKEMLKNNELLTERHIDYFLKNNNYTRHIKLAA